jgi:hypothetical protein
MGKAVPAYQQSDRLTPAAQGLDALRRGLFLNVAGYTHRAFNYNSSDNFKLPTVECGFQLSPWDKF